jgi:hypothetical protein
MARQRGRSVPTIERQVRPETWIAWRKQRYQVKATDGILLKVVNKATGEEVDIEWIEILSPSDDANDQPVFASTEEALNVTLARRSPAPQPAHPTALHDSYAKKAKAIVETVELIHRLLEKERRAAALRGDTKFRVVDTLRKLCRQLKLGLSTYYKYDEIYRQYNGDEILIGYSLRRKSFGKTRMSKAQLHFAERLILSYYVRGREARFTTQSGLYEKMEYIAERTGNRWIDPEKCGPIIPEDLISDLMNPRVPMQDILANEERKALLTHIKVPSAAWLKNYLRWFRDQPDLDEHMLEALFGEDAVKHEHRIWEDFIILAQLALEHVVADHYLIKVPVVDEESRSDVEWLWLTVLIDAYTRSILGFALCYEPPSIYSIQAALKHAIFPKTSHLEFGITKPWNCFGILRNLSLDNAWGHLSHSLERLARGISQNGRYLEITLDWRPPYRGRYGALVERYFGNLAAKIRTYIETSYQKWDYRSTRNAVKHACLLYGDINEFIHQCVVTYQHTRHSELNGMTPHEKMEESLAKIGIAPPPPPESGILRLFWRHFPDSRKLSQSGISALGMHYKSDELSTAPWIDQMGQRIEYHFTYDPDNINRIAVFRDGMYLCDAYASELLLPDGTYKALSLWEREMGMALARKAGRSGRDWQEFIAGFSQRQQRRAAEKRKIGSLAVGEQVPPPVNATDVEQGLEQTAVDGRRDYTQTLSNFSRSKR